MPGVLTFKFYKMKLDIDINGQKRSVEIVSEHVSSLVFKVDGKIYHTDIRHTSEFVYSLLLEQNSYNIELSPIDGSPKKYFVNHGIDNMVATLTDCQTRYAQSRNISQHTDNSNVILTPMPGKIVKILVKEGDTVKAGDTVVIVEAMKMQSEYKSSGDKTIKKILVNEGDPIESNQPLVVLE